MNPTVDYIALSGITTAMVELAKKFDGEAKYERFYPIVSLVIGFILGMLSGLPWLLSLTVGLTASGFYSQVKTLRGK
jgi:hypothetical protein